MLTFKFLKRYGRYCIRSLMPARVGSTRGCLVQSRGYDVNPSYAQVALLLSMLGNEHEAYWGSRYEKELLSVRTALDGGSEDPMEKLFVWFGKLAMLMACQTISSEELALQPQTSVVRHATCSAHSRSWSAHFAVTGPCLIHLHRSLTWAVEMDSCVKFYTRWASRTLSAAIIAPRLSFWQRFVSDALLRLESSFFSSAKGTFRKSSMRSDAKCESFVACTRTCSSHICVHSQGHFIAGGARAFQVAGRARGPQQLGHPLHRR